MAGEERAEIEEADIILLNKIDLIESRLESRLLEFLAQECPRATRIPCSARDGVQLESWFEILEGTGVQEQGPLEIDYALYARGEAALGWLNATLRLESSAGVDGNILLSDLCRQIREGLEETGLEVAHLKATLDPGFPSGEIAVVSIVENRTLPELRASVVGDVRTGQLILNLRAEASPDQLEAGARKAIEALGASTGSNLTIEHLECFRPAAPRPQYRLTQEDMAEVAFEQKRD